MKFAVAVLAAILLSSLSASAAIHGVVTNETTGKPQAGVEVAVMKLEGGMVQIGSAVSGPDGKFSIDVPPPAADVPYLVSGTYQDVAYHAAARDVTTDVNVKVYEKTTDKSAVKYAVEQLIAEPRSDRLMISEIYTVRNETSPPRTLVATGTDKDTFHFTAAHGLVQDLQVAISGPSALPLKQTATEHDKGVYGVEFPFRPGETKIEVNYRLPYDSSFTFEKSSTKSLLSGSPEIAVIVPMQGVQVAGSSLTLNHEEPKQGAAFYDWKSAAPLKFTLNGALPDNPAGAVPNQVAAPGAGLGAQAEELSTMENQNFIFQARWKILIVLGSALILGLAYLYRTTPVLPPPTAANTDQPQPSVPAPPQNAARR